MWLQVINYSIRALIIVVGIVLVSGYVSSPEWDDTFLKVMGSVFILFGIYRIVIYRTQLKRYNLFEEDEDEE